MPTQAGRVVVTTTKQFCPRAMELLTRVTERWGQTNILLPKPERCEIPSRPATHPWSKPAAKDAVGTSKDEQGRARAHLSRPPGRLAKKTEARIARPYVNKMSDPPGGSTPGCNGPFEVPILEISSNSHHGQGQGEFRQASGRSA